jgi:hypothetical protein
VPVFLKEKAGLAREKAPPGPGASKVSEWANAWVRSLERAGRRLASKGRVLEIRARRLGGGKVGGIRAENIVWIFGAGRTGSTWLAAMMDELKGQTVWREPLVGALFGNLYYDRAKHLIGKPGKHYILGDGYRRSWLGSIRAFVLREATGRFPEAAGPGRSLVIQEPNGSFGAPLLMEALPESRMVLLVRDPRDVTASSMDAKRTGGWQYESRKRWKPESPVDKDPDAFVKIWSTGYLHSIELAKQAYDAHKGRKVLVRYEELRADTLGTMRRIYSELGISVDEGELRRAVEKHSWESIPEEEKGEGKFYRKAAPGRWREDLTPEQVEMVERITAPLLEEFYPGNTP